MREISFSFQLNCDVQSLLYIFKFDALNAHVTLLAKILELDKVEVYDDAATALRRTRMNPNSNATHIAFPTTAFCESYMQNKDQTVLYDSIVHFFNSICSVLHPLSSGV